MRRAPTTTFMECVPAWRTAMFNVTVDAGGHVKNSKQIGDLGDILDSMNGKAHGYRL